MRKVGILVGGGPAPGTNAIIGAATIEGINQGCEVVGFYDGLQWLADDDFDPRQHTIPLSIQQVARIHFDGGSILRSARSTLLDDSRLQHGPVQPDAARTRRVVRNLHEMDIGCLITIGGDDTALAAQHIMSAASPRFRVVHVPKTIDNDLPLPHDTPTLGYSTARFWGAQIVKNLMSDSQSTSRWYVVTAMGRSAGWLALGIGYSAGATLTLIPEEFPTRITLQHLADILEGAILKRRMMGRHDGVAVLAEGLAQRLGDRDELEALVGREVPLDASGQLRLSDLPVADLLRNELVSRFERRGEPLHLVTSQLGYQLRSADPTPGDMAYCRSLGHGCIRVLLDDSATSARGVMLTLAYGNLEPLPLADIIDPQTGRMRVRLIDTTSDTYQAARAYMIRLERRDLDDPDSVRRLAKEARMTPDAFKARFAATVGDTQCASLED